MRCPTCDLPLKPATVEGQPFERCGGCGGEYFAHHALQEVLSAHAPAPGAARGAGYGMLHGAPNEPRSRQGPGTEPESVVSGTLDSQMILEVAVLDVVPGKESEFELAFERASPLIASMGGYLGHSLRCCMERSSRYLLLVRWKTLEDHTRGFRSSSEYQEWKRLLHHFYDPFPTVEHFSPPLLGSDWADGAP